MKNMFGLNDPEHDWRDSIAVITGIGAWLILLLLVAPFLVMGWIFNPNWHSFALFPMYYVVYLGVPGTLIGLIQRWGPMRRVLLPLSAVVGGILLAPLYMKLGALTRPVSLGLFFYMGVSPVAGVLMAWCATRRQIGRLTMLATLWLLPVIPGGLDLAVTETLAFPYPHWHLARSLYTGFSVGGPWATQLARIVHMSNAGDAFSLPLALVASVILGFILVALFKRAKPRPGTVIVCALFLGLWTMIGYAQILHCLS